MEMVTKTVIRMLFISVMGGISLMAADDGAPKTSNSTQEPGASPTSSNEVKPVDPSQATAKAEPAVTEKVVLTKEQLKAAAFRLSSRYTKLEKEEAANALGSKLRSIDPFGLPTYPKANEEVIEDEVIDPVLTTAEPERITLGHALRTIKINGINLERTEVLIGSRNMFEGDIAEIFFKGQTFMAELTEVSGYRLVFIDTKTKEEFTKTLTMLPAPNFEPSKNLDSKLSLQENARQLESIAK